MPLKQRLKTVDAARGLAEFWVLAFHALLYLQLGFVGGVVGGYAPGVREGLRSIAAPPPPGIDWLKPLRVGDLGVPIFFVVSGFCIHWPAARAGRNFRFSLPVYAKRRFWRLYPTHFVAIIGSIALSVGIWKWAEAKVSVGPFVTVPWSVIVAHFAMLQSQIPFTARYTYVYNPNLWSLETEFQLYAAYILLRPIGNRIGWSRLLLGVLPISVAFLVVGYDGAGNFGSGRWWAIRTCAIGHLFDWTLGAYIAECLCRGQDPRATIGWAAIALAVCHGLVVEIPIEGLRFMIAAIATAVLLWKVCARELDGGKTFPGAHWLGWYGERSYSLYLWHAPVLKAFYIMLAVQIPWISHYYSCTLAAAVLGAVISLYVARLSYWLVERHFVRQAPLKSPNVGQYAKTSITLAGVHSP
jgi:peptidoglycan/LPS O-acetylase OafA/YrhL